jgi:anti-sigma factor RsiW
MNCVYERPLDEVELLMSLDGEASPEVEMHLAQCPQCSQRAADLARVQHLTLANLYRAVCPPSLELGEYHLKLLPAAQAATVQRHLALCPHCTEELAQLTSFMKQADPYLHPTPGTALRRQVNVLIARLASAMPPARASGQPLFAPALAGLRGAEREPLRYEAGAVQVILEVQRDDARADRQLLDGLVLGLDEALQATLWRAEQQIAAAPVDDLGNFTVGNLTPGQYELILAGEQDEVHIQNLHI